MSEPQESNVEEGKRKWRKKRKTFLSNAKKYARKGQMGRGTKMPEDTYQYFVGILEVMKKGVDTEDEKISLVNNVLDRTRGEEISVAGNQLGCRVVELLLPYASPGDLERYMEALYPELRRLCADNFSSHVIEKLLTVTSQRATDHLQDDTVPVAENEDSDSETPSKKIKIESNKICKKYTDEHLQKCHDFTIKICKYALNNMEDFVFNDYANHILRSAMRCLSGITLIPGEKLKKNVFKDLAEKDVLHKSIPPHTTQMKYRTVPQEFKDIVREYAERLSQWPQFKDMPYRNLTSGLVQIMLYAIKAVDKKLTKNILRKLLDESFAPESSGDVDDDKKNAEPNLEKTTPAVFSSEPAIRCLEAALLVAKKKTYTQIYARCFIGHLPRAVTMPALNFTVQRLLDNCQLKEELEMMFDELQDSFSAVMSCGNTGVLVALVKACERLKARQTQFITALESALKVTEESRRLPTACLVLAPGRKPQSTGYTTNIHGALVLQSMLHFQRPTKIVNAMLEQSQEELLYIFCDTKGCHVADAFFKAPFVGVKSRDKMVWLLRGSYQQLAMSKYGSRAFEVIFGSCTLEQKVKIMEELSEKGQLLNSTTCGRLIAEKLMLHQFRASQDKWKVSINKLEKQKKLFTQILPKQEADS